MQNPSWNPWQGQQQQQPQDQAAMFANYQQIYGGQQTPMNPPQLTPLQMQQWQQWQQQYQLWQQQYGKKYEESLKQMGNSQQYNQVVAAPQFTNQQFPVPPPVQQPPPPLPPDEVKPPLPVGPVKTELVPPTPAPAPVEPPEELSEAEKNFDIQFKQWEQQFEKWKTENSAHPDKVQYREYEKKWESWREQLLQRREQMKKKRLLSKLQTPSSITPNKPTDADTVSNLFGNAKVPPLKQPDSSLQGPFNTEPLQFVKKPSHLDEPTLPSQESLTTDSKDLTSWFNKAEVALTPSGVNPSKEVADANPVPTPSDLPFFEKTPKNEFENANFNFPPAFATTVRGKPMIVDPEKARINSSSSLQNTDTDKNNQQGLGQRVLNFAGNQGPGFNQKPNQAGNFGPNQGANFGRNQMGNFGPNLVGNFGPNQVGNFGPNQGGNFGPNQGGNFGPNQGGTFGPNQSGNFGPNQVGNFGPNQGGSFGPNQGGNFGPNQSGNFGPSQNWNHGPNRGSNFGPNRNNDFGPNQGRNFGSNSGDNFGPNHKGRFGPDQTNRTAGPFGNDMPQNVGAQGNENRSNFNDRSDDRNNFFGRDGKNHDEAKNYQRGPDRFNERLRGPREFNDNRPSDRTGDFRDSDFANDTYGDVDRGNFNDGVDNYNRNARMPDHSGRNFDGRDFNDLDERADRSRQFENPNRNSIPGLMDVNLDLFKNKEPSSGWSGNQGSTVAPEKRKLWEKYERDDYYDDPFEEREDDKNMGKQWDDRARERFNDRNDGRFNNNFDVSKHDFDERNCFPAFDQQADNRFRGGPEGPNGPPRNVPLGALTPKNNFAHPHQGGGPNSGPNVDQNLSGFVGNILAKLGVQGGVGQPSTPPNSENSRGMIHPKNDGRCPPENDEWKPQVFDYSSLQRKPEDEIKFAVVDYSHGGSNQRSFDYGHGSESSTRTIDYGHGGSKPNQNVIDYGHKRDSPLDGKNSGIPRRGASPEPRSRGFIRSPDRRSDFENRSQRDNRSPSSRGYNRGSSDNWAVTNRSPDRGGRRSPEGRGFGRGVTPERGNSRRSQRSPDQGRGDRSYRSPERGSARESSRYGNDRGRRSPDRGRDGQKSPERGFNKRYSPDRGGRNYPRSPDRRYNQDSDTYPTRDRGQTNASGVDRRDTSRSNRENSPILDRDRNFRRERDRGGRDDRDRDRSPIRSRRSRSRSPGRSWRKDDKKKDEKIVETKTEDKFGGKREADVTTILVEDILCAPGRVTRPNKIVFILRGVSGSGKSHVTRLIKTKELELGGAVPRILSIDDYFMTDVEEEVKDEETGQCVRKKVLKYEYDKDLDVMYQAALIKAFKKTISDGFFSFIVVDSVNNAVKDVEEMWSFAKQKGFQVYIAEMDNDVAICSKRTQHGRSETEIEKQVKEWETTPPHYLRLDVRSLLQAEAIEEVEMEDVDVSEPQESFHRDSEKQEEEDESTNNAFLKSKWDDFETSVQKLDRLDGLKKKKPTETMEDFLSSEDFDAMETSIQSGKKRVRWADLEERRHQEKMRAIGFVVGQTDWKRMTDPTFGESALTRTKYF